MTLILLVIASALLLPFYRLVRPGCDRSGPYLPDAFVLGLALFSTGTLVVVWEDEYVAAAIVSAMAFTALVSGLAGAIVFSALASPLYERLDFKQIHRHGAYHSPERALIIGLITASLLVCSFFLYKALTSSLLAPFLALSGIEQGSLNIARVAMSYGSAGYFAPGYIKQFRDILIPIALCATLLLYEHPLRRPFFWSAILLAMGAMLVAGQRFDVVVLLACLAMASYYVTQIAHLDEPGHRVKWGRLALIGVLIISLFGALSFALGRHGSNAAIDNGASRELKIPIPIIGDMVERIVLVWPRENSETYGTWSVAKRGDGEPFGAEFAGLAYNTSDPLTNNMLHLSNELAARTGGGIQGNSPLGLAPLTWLSFGWLGLVVAPFFFAIFFGFLDVALLSEASPLFFGAKLYLFIALPICASPYLFVLNGGAAVLILVVIVKAFLAFARWSASSQVPT